MLKDNTNPKVDLDLVKKLVTELDKALVIAENIKTDTKAGMQDYVIELQKASGLAAGIMSEAALLVLDIKVLTNTIQGAPSSSKGLGEMEKILGALKGSGFGGNN